MITAATSYRIEVIGSWPYIITIMDYVKQNGGIPLAEDPVLKNIHFEPQSDVSATTVTIHADNQMHSSIMTAGDSGDVTDDGFSPDAGIDSFMKRKVLIHKITWPVGTAISAGISPWFLFLNNTAVKNKLQHYMLFKGDLKLTIYINGTKMHCGLMLASYLYLNHNTDWVTAGGDTQLVTRSQREHIYLDPTVNGSGCLCVPFFLPENYLSLVNPKVDATDMGLLHFTSIGDLLQISAGTDPVTITVFAEMVNYKLTGPTTQAIALSGEDEFDDYFFEPQADDEYGSGIVSKPASTVASIAGMLSSAPIIGPFARATEIGASAVSAIAKMFGYSRPVQLDNIAFMRNMPVGSLATTDSVDTSQKLTTDSKQELCIDTRTVGLIGEDELALSYLTKKETFLTHFFWDTGDTVDTNIFALDVDPMAELRTSITGGYRIIPTALSFASRPFNNWCGTIKYRFKVIGSSFHSGRLSIIYDPTGDLASGIDPYNVTNNGIIDIGADKDFCMEFKWQQDKGYQLINTDDTNPFFNTSNPNAHNGDVSTANGTFWVRVATQLVVPDGVTPVRIAVMISAGDDFELINPNAENMNVKDYPPVVAQSDTLIENFTFEPQAASDEVKPQEENAPEFEGEVVNITQGVKTKAEQRPMVFFGEKITSFRALLKRYALSRTHSLLSPGTVLTNNVFRLRQMPFSGGYDPNGYDIAVTTIPYWFTGQTYISYLKRAYAGWRGSVRWKFVPVTDIKSMSVTRGTSDVDNGTAVTVAQFLATPMPKTSNPSEMARAGLIWNDLGCSGMALTACHSQEGLEVEIPYAKDVRFSQTIGDYAGANVNTLENSYPGGDTFYLSVFTQEDNDYVVLNSYVAAGEDFNLFGFMGAPVVYKYAHPAAGP